jgi:hypothetical protein
MNKINHSLNYLVGQSMWYSVKQKIYCYPIIICQHQQARKCKQGCIIYSNDFSYVCHRNFYELLPYSTVTVNFQEHISEVETREYGK